MAQGLELAHDRFPKAIWWPFYLYDHITGTDGATPLPLQQRGQHGPLPAARRALRIPLQHVIILQGIVSTAEDILGYGFWVQTWWVSYPTALAACMVNRCYFRARMGSGSPPASEYATAQNPTVLEHHRHRTSRGLPPHAASCSRDSLTVALPCKNTQPGSEPLRFPALDALLLLASPNPPSSSAKPKCQQTRLRDSRTLM